MEFRTPVHFRFKGCWVVVFLFIQIFKEHGDDPCQTPHSAASDLGLHCLPMSHKKDAWLLCVKSRFQYGDHTDHVHLFGKLQISIHAKIAIFLYEKIQLMYKIDLSLVSVRRVLCPFLQY